MNKGFGLCGHKGSFSTNVKLGNWVEDEYGEILSKIPNRGQGPTPASEARAAYIDPATMPDKAGGVCEESTLESREGLSADMLFSHPMSADKMPANTEKIGVQYSTQAIEARAIKLEQEKHSIPISEAHASTQNVPQIKFKLNEKDAEALPNFARRKIKCHNNVIHL